MTNMGTRQQYTIVLNIGEENARVTIHNAGVSVWGSKSHFRAYREFSHSQRPKETTISTLLMWVESEIATMIQEEEAKEEKQVTAPVPPSRVLAFLKDNTVTYPNPEDTKCAACYHDAHARCYCTCGCRPVLVIRPSPPPDIRDR